jgi:transcription antitermination factor NusG
MRWYVARTQPHKERYAVAALDQRGIETYLPIVIKQRSRAGRREWEPLFASYVFARLDVSSNHWLAARACTGVAYFLGHRGQPSALPDDLVPTIRARLESINRIGGLPSFRHGQRVTIIESSFRHYEAMFDRRLSPAGRSRVLVSVLNRIIPIELPETYLRASN